MNSEAIDCLAGILLTKGLLLNAIEDAKHSLGMEDYLEARQTVIDAQHAEDLDRLRMTLGEHRSV